MRRQKLTRNAIERLDLLILAIETIDLNSTKIMLSYANQLGFNSFISNEVDLWRIRSTNPLRKSFGNLSRSISQEEALIKIVSSTSDHLYPYIRSILDSRYSKDLENSFWGKFINRFTELVSERLDINKLRVHKLVNLKIDDDLYTSLLLTLSLSCGPSGILRLKNLLYSI